MFGRDGSEGRVGDGPRAEGAAAVGAVTSGHGPHEWQPLLPLLEVEVGVGQIAVDEWQCIEISDVFVGPGIVVGAIIVSVIDPAR